MKIKSLTLTQKNSFKGFAFTLPFCIGFFAFFFRPFIQTVQFAFSRVNVDIGGYIKEFTGLDNMNHIFNVDANFETNILGSFKNLLWQLPVVLIASLFFAMLINKEFKGRTLVRAIFFLPVIISSGVIIKVIQSDAAAASILSGNVVAGGEVTQNMGLVQLLGAFDLPETVADFLSNIVNNLFGTIWSCGIQMIIFLAGLQSVPSSLYEASAVEGASGWEDFWMITIPMLAPMILVNAVYTVIDSFTSASNMVMLQVMNNMNQLRLGWSAAMTIVYFLFIIIVLMLLLWIFNLISKRKL